MTPSVIIGGVIAFFKAIPILDSWLQQLVAAYVASYSKATLAQIADAAAMSARAETDEERYVAAGAWRDALKRDRMSV